MNKTTPFTSLEIDHVIDFTLPDELDFLLSDSPVMYAEPPENSGGPRSGGIIQRGGAVTERPEFDAKQRSQDGDEVVHCNAKRQVTPAAVARNINVIDKNIVNGVSASTFVSATELSESDAFEIIKLARSLLKLDATERKKRIDTTPTTATIAQYTRKCQLMDDAVAAIQDQSAPPLTLVLSRYTHKKRSFAVMRAALKWRATNKVRKLLSAQDAMQITSSRSAAWKRCVGQLDAAVRELKEIELLTHAECLVFSDRKVEHRLFLMH